MDAVTLALAKAYTNSQRLAYVETNKTVVFPETAMEFSDTEGVYVSVVKLAEPLPVKDGDTLTVVFDGTKYKTTVSKSEMEGEAPGSGLFSFGNLSVAGLGDDTGEPFMVMYTQQYFENDSPANLVLSVLSATSETSHTIAINKETETIHPIDPKYIPALDSITLNSPGGKQFVLTVDDTGAIAATET